MFLRKSTLRRDPLPMAMIGVRLGERVLQLGVDDPWLTGAIAAKAGLTGQAAVAVTTDAAAGKAHGAAADAGTLLDVHVTPMNRLPFDASAFDVIVVHSMNGLVATLDDATRMGMAGECLRVLRHGGRLIVIEPGRGAGLSGLLRRAGGAAAFERQGGAAAVLAAAGFRAVRVLAEREGYRFTEGIKGGDLAPA
jgi:SAM-dependent methyltransferase